MVSCLHVHVEQFSEIVAKTGEEREVLPLSRTFARLDLLEFIQHLHGDFERVLQQAMRLTVVMIGARRHVTDEFSQARNDTSSQIASLKREPDALKDLVDQVFD